MEDYGVAKGYIDLDISKLERAIQTGVRELDNLDRKSALVESEFNRMQSAGNKVGGVFRQAAQKSKMLTEQMAQSKSKCELYNKEISNLNTIISAAKEKQGELGNKIKETTAKYEQSEAKIKKTAEAHGKESEEYTKAVQKSRELENGLNQLKTQYDALDIEVEQSEQSIVDFKTKLNNTEASINAMNQQLAESQNKVLLYGQAWHGAGEKLRTVGDKINGVGNKLSIGITTPIVAAGTASVKLASDAVTSFAKVSTIADSTVLSYEDMEKGVKSSSNETGVAITDFNEALYQSLSAGIETGNAIGFTADMVKLAKGGFTDTSKAVDVVTSVLNAYGLSADQATSVSDKLIKTQNIGKTTVDELSNTLGRIIPTAKAFGVGIDDVSTSMAVLTKRGIQTAEATTYYNSMLNELGTSGSKADTALRELSGKGFQQLISEGVPATDILQMLNDKAASNGQSLADMFGSMEAGKAALSIMSDGGAEYNEILGEMQNSAGATQEAFEKMDATPAAKMQKEVNKLKNAGIEAGTQILPIVTDVMTSVGDLAEKYSKLPEKQQKSIVKTAGFAAALGPVLKVVGGTTRGIGDLTTGVGKMMEALGNRAAAKTAESALQGIAGAATKAGGSTGILSAATAALASPVGIAVAAVGALAGGMYLANKAEEARIERIGQLTGKEKELADAINQQHQSYTDMEERRQTSLDSINAEAQRTQNLADELRTLVDENGRVRAGDEERASYITNELSEALGTEVSLVDGVIQNYGELNNSIDETIEKRKALAIQEALKDDYVEAVRNQAEAQKQYNEELKNVEKYERKLEDAKQAVVDVESKYADANMENKGIASQAASEHAKASEEVKKYAGKLDHTREALKKAGEAYIGYSETIQNYEGLSAALDSNDAAQVEMALTKIQEHFLTAETATKESLSKQVDAIKEKYEEMKKAVEQGAPGVTQEAVDAMGQLAEQATSELETKTEQEKITLINMFKQCGIEAPQGMIDALVQKSPETQAAVLDMLDSVSTGTSLKKDELKSLLSSLGIEAPQGLINSLKDQKPQVQMEAMDLLMQLQNAESGKRSEILAQFQSLGPEASTAIITGLAQANISGNLNAESQKELQSFLDGFSGLDSETQTIWSQAWYGALEGLQGFENLADPAKEGVDAFLESLKSALEVHSPSGATKRIFSQVWPGANEGLNDGKEGLFGNGGSIVTSFLDGIIEKIESNKERVKEALGGVGSDGKESMQQALISGNLRPPGVDGINGKTYPIGTAGNTQMGIGLRYQILAAPGVNNINNASNSIGISGNNQMGIGLRSSNLNPPSVNDIDGDSKASKARSEMQSHFDNNPLSVVVNVVKKIGGVIGDALGFADGGIATSPAIFGEAGPEMAIPLSASKRARALSLYERTGDILGVSEEESAMKTRAMNNFYMAKKAAKSMNEDSIVFNMQKPNYDLLAEKIVKGLKSAPITTQVTVEMQDGDVFMGDEKVGRKLAPVISRVISQNT